MSGTPTTGSQSAEALAQLQVNGKWKLKMSLERGQRTVCKSIRWKAERDREKDSGGEKERRGGQSQNVRELELDSKEGSNNVAEWESN